jgi:acetoin utilization deacetylase AcuC-like enzyme
MKTGFFYDPIYLEHDTGNHPENAERLRAIVAWMREQGLMERLDTRPSRPATEEEVALIHELDYLRRVEEAALSGRTFLDTPDCAMSEATFRVSLHAAGAVAEAVRCVAEGRLDNAFVACRPPGHHAEARQALGFCFFNNIAIGAAILTCQMGYRRALIFDFDVHHGNGTQHAFEESKQVFFVSMHQDPRTCYPGTGYAEERGRGEGLGYTVNVPMPPYSADEDYLSIFRQRLLPLFREYDPEFVLLSAGFDAHRDDPLAQIQLTQAGFDAMTREIKSVALERCGGRIVSILEGGYHYARLAECVASHVSILQSDPA